ncbi:transcriptional repressor [Nanchangia anserum]|uniref:Fur family transcriptional regulator n=1 Tax=Nanchangia anserum TaxID=2692125 RepID=UPI00188365A1|nr:Fur family transcriptional regulator [Nanchangia anserum]QOX81321.1 transcriptional repressor [Nanchangia anserum]
MAASRKTRQRSAVERLLNDSTEFLSAQHIHHRLIHEGTSIGLATVYRNLTALADAHLVDVIHNQDGEALYRRCQHQESPHYHLICRSCGMTRDVADEAVETQLERLFAEHGFAEAEHSADLFGLCTSCADSDDS